MISDYGQVTPDECQYLCQITKECLYYNHNKHGVCWLKYGIGTKKEVNSPDDSRYMGNKYSSGGLDLHILKVMFLIQSQ